jgi:hypothetical protein
LWSSDWLYFGIQYKTRINDMKTGQLFWGAFFLTFGSLLLLVKYDILDVNWSFAWEFWPVILILWGLSVILKDTVFKPIVGFLFGVFLAVFIYGTVLNVTDVFDYDLSYKSDPRIFYENFQDDVEYANLELSAGVGYFSIRDETSKLIKASAWGNSGSYSLNSNYNDDTAYLDLDFGKNSIYFFNTEIKNRLDIKLNDKPVWDIELNLGAAKANFDFSRFKVSRILLETGATETKIRIGDKLDRVNVDVEMGAASLQIYIPSEFECKLTGDMVFVAKDIPGMIKRGRGYYTTSDYEFADKKIKINVDGGVASLTIKRY